MRSWISSPDRDRLCIFELGLGGDDLGPTIAADLLLGADAWVDMADILLLGV